MNERYLFRGKRVDTGEWVQGYLSKGRMKGYKNMTLQSCIDLEEQGVMLSSVVDSSTIGQCTGLLDKNGIPIFEGDVIEIVMPLGKVSKPITRRSPVFWSESSWRVHWLSDRDETRIDGFANSVTFEVIGNVYEENFNDEHT